MAGQPKRGDIVSLFLTKPDFLTFSMRALYGLNLLCGVCGGGLSGIAHLTQEATGAGQVPGPAARALYLKGLQADLSGPK